MQLQILHCRIMQMQILQMQKMQKNFCINTKNTQKHAHAQPIFRIFFYNYKINAYEQLHFYLVKNRNSQITKKRKTNEKKKNERKKEKM